MAVHALTIFSQEEGGDTEVTITSNAVFLSDMNLDRIAGGSGAEQVKIGAIRLKSKFFRVDRNIGDGTHFQVILQVETNDPTITIQVTKANNHGSITYSTAHDNAVHTVQPSPQSFTLTL